MKVEFTFDNSRIEQNGYTLEDIRYTIKKMFVERNIRCISDNNILAFEDSGGKKENRLNISRHDEYKSRKQITIYSIIELTEKLAKELPWLYKCVNEIDVTDIGNKQYSLKQILDDSAKALDVAIKKK